MNHAMTVNQKALTNAIAAAGIGIILLGIGLLIFDVNNVHEICRPSAFSGQYCVKEDTSLRGLFLAGFGFVVMIAVTYAQTTLSKKAA